VDVVGIIPRIHNTTHTKNKKEILSKKKIQLNNILEEKIYSIEKDIICE
jgi:hypothetical protein